ncbi:MAG: gliding motility protein GldL [Chitinophagaceae bacterium]|uniref:type IX secretion system motor protein PorL/GldL n=1 Tax=Parasegetibacter sp. NRK P23 TaxID=2942999 RepID=UPI0020435DED|nr:gliding motility protein GldL [Parasegetibacter sp. NRK P23]MCM5527546.1 gliding motility protein GldL [Parasegetibacter sp. NRK P23]
MAGQSKSVDRIVNVIVCVGAAVVIFGAWAKILHKPFADIMLTVGLLTEAGIFIVYALLPPPGNDMEPLIAALPKISQGSSNPALAKLDNMMQDADITPANLQKLSESFKSLGTTVTQMKDMTNVVAATSDYTAKTKEAAAALGTVKEAYLGAASSLGAFNQAADGTKQFHEQVQLMTKNLGSLNTIYELELQDTNNHLKAMNKFYGNLSSASQALQGSVEDAKKTQEQIGVLAKNLSNLNQVYGNMLNAMQGRS